MIADRLCFGAEGLKLIFCREFHPEGLTTEGCKCSANRYELIEQQGKGDATVAGDLGGLVANEHEWRMTACSR
jgi:hypothetical protein